MQAPPAHRGQACCGPLQPHCALLLRFGPQWAWNALFLSTRSMAFPWMGLDTQLHTRTRSDCAGDIR